MFTVYDSNKPAKYPDHSVDPSWHTASFKTMTEAVAHAKNWLGRTYEGVLPKFWDGTLIDYSGCGDTIEIRKE
jgi:hypothetical protein